MALTLPQRPHAAKTVTGTGIFVEENLKAAEQASQHMGRYVKVRLKSGVTLERQIDMPFIKALQLGQFTVITDLR